MSGSAAGNGSIGPSAACKASGITNQAKCWTPGLNASELSTVPNLMRRFFHVDPAQIGANLFRV